MKLHFALFKSLLIVALVLGVILLPHPTPALAASCTWDGTTGNWSNAAKWTGCSGVAPGAGDTAIINSGTVTLDTHVTVQGLTFGGGTLTGSNNITVTGTLNWSGGTHSGSGTTTSNGTLAWTGGTLDTRTFNNAGSATWSTGYLNLNNTATFNNQAGASFQMTMNAGNYLNTSGGGTFNNAGYFTKTVGSSSTNNLYVPFNNTGSVVVNGGTLVLNGSVASASSGTIKVGSGATLQFDGGGAQTLSGSVTGVGTVRFQQPSVDFSSGTYSVTNTIVAGGAAVFEPGVTFTSPNVTVSGGTLNLSTGSAINLSTLTLSGGTLTGSDNLVVTTMTWSGGTHSGSGTTTLNGTLDWTGGTLDTRTFNNAGSATWSTGYLNLNNTATFNNQAGASFQMTMNTGNYLNTSGGGTFNNAGYFTKTVGSSSTNNLYVPFNNTGSVVVNGGTLVLNGNVASASSGPFQVGSGATLQFDGGGAQTLTGNVTGAGTVRFQQPTVTFNSGTYSVTNTAVAGGTALFNPGATFTSPNVTVSGGTLNLSTGSAINLSTLTLSGGTLTGSDSLVVATMTWSGGTHSGSGTTTVNGTLNWTGGTLDGRTLNNAGSATWSGTGSIYFSNNAVFNNQAGASFQATHTGNPSFGSNSGTFNNAGYFTKTVSSNGFSYMYAAFNNSGTVVVNGGTLQLYSSNPSVSSGSFQVAAGATLRFDNSGAHDLTGSIMGAGTVLFTQPTVNYNSGTYSVTNTAVSGGVVLFKAGTTYNSLTTTVSGGTLNLSTGALYLLAPTAVNLNTLTLSSGTLTGADNLVVTNMTWSGGTMSGSGATTVNGTLNWTGGTLDGRTLNNAGMATWSSSYLYFSNNAVFNNQAGASFLVTHLSNLSLYNSGTFNNAGVFTKTTGTGLTTVQLDFNNSGKVVLETGTLRLYGSGASNSSGAFAVNSGATLGFDSGTHNLSGSITGAGTGEFTGATVNLGAGSVYSLPETTVSSGTANFANASGAIFGNLNQSGGTLSLGNASISGNFIRTNYTTFNAGSGTLVFNGAAQNLSLSYATTFYNLTVYTGTTLIETAAGNNAIVAGKLTNYGTVRKTQNVAATGPVNFGLTGVMMTVTVKGTLSNVQADLKAGDHPNADTRTATGRYWSLLPTGDAYSVTLTLPHNITPDTNAFVCRYVSDIIGSRWDCARSSSTATTVSRADIPVLSEWAVGGTAENKIYLPLVIR